MGYSISVAYLLRDRKLLYTKHQYNKHGTTYQLGLETTAITFRMDTTNWFCGPGKIYVRVKLLKIKYYSNQLRATIADDYETFWWDIPVIDHEGDLR